NHAGELSRLVEIAEPDVRVWTNVGDAHIGHFGSREAIAAAKAEILEPTPTPAVVIANADDPLVRRHIAVGALPCITFGEAADADVRAVDVVDRGYDGVEARIVTSGGAIDVTIRLAGRANLSNVLAAAAAAAACDVPLDVIRHA